MIMPYTPKLISRSSTNPNRKEANMMTAASTAHTMGTHGPPAWTGTATVRNRLPADQETREQDPLPLEQAVTFTVN